MLQSNLSSPPASPFKPFAIAVYGTLRHGAGANALFKGSKYLGQDKISGNIYNLGAYPGLRLDKDGGEVVVDLYEIESPQKLKSLDNYEGYHPEFPESSLYIREEVLTLEGAMKVSTYVYNNSPRDEQFIKTGDWFDVQY